MNCGYVLVAKLQLVTVTQMVVG